MRVVDLRSDTVTLPPPGMREAILRAPLGDDVYGEDPTVRKLEELAAEITGKEAGLLVVSGTMGNLVSILVHCGRGDEVILGDQCHTFLYEAGGIAALGGIHPHPVPNDPDGTMPLEKIEAAVRPDNIHFPRTRLVCLENTHNRCWGSPLTPEYTQEVVELARRHGLAVHLDGARIFNAAAALGVEVEELASGVDSVTFCLSKGLAAPVGSVICGERGFIEEALRVRKLVGGAMRQAGSSLLAGSTPSSTWWRGSPRTTRTHSSWPMGSPTSTASIPSPNVCAPTSSTSSSSGGILRNSKSDVASGGCSSTAPEHESSAW